MIYLKNNTETQSIYIPRQTVLGSGYIATTEKYEEGYNDGFEDGKEQQKEKLSNLRVTENGQYEREDGWDVVTVDVPDLNGSYDEGYEEGERVGYEQGKTDGVNEQKGKLSQITISENGTYAKEDGYNEVVVNVPDLNGDYNEGYEQGKADGINEQKDKLESISITENGVYSKEDGYNHIEVNVPDLNGSYNEGYAQGKIDGIDEQKSKLEHINITENGTYTKEDGYNEVVVNVPDLNGDYNEGYNQGKADVVANARDIEVTKNGQYGDGETLYKNINVNVVPKVNVEKAGLNFGYSSFTKVPEWADFEGITDMDKMFYECQNLQTIPFIDTSNVTKMSYMFYDCADLQTIPQIDTSKVTNMYYMLAYCRNLQTIPYIDTSNVTDMNGLFQGCLNLQTIPQIDTSNVKSMDGLFYECTSLVSIPALNAKSLIISSYGGFVGYYELPKLTDFGGFLNLKSSLESDNNFKKLPNLTYQSCINVLNGLYDFTGNGETPNRNQGKLKVHQNFLDKVGEEISIGTNKGWTITA